MHHTIEKKERLVHVFEIEEQVADGLKNVVDVPKLLTAAHAFRKYHWLLDKPATNRLGTLTGMVVHGQCRAAFEVFHEASEALGDVALLATLAKNIANSSGEIEAILRSSDSRPEKGRSLSYFASGLVLRSLAQGPVDGIHLMAKAEHGIRTTAGFFGANVTHPGMTQNLLDFANARVESWADLAFNNCAYIRSKLHLK